MFLGCTPEIFTSASGHSLVGYPVCIKNVLIGNVLFPKFYYYLILDELEGNRAIALLGDNFIDCCRFEHYPHEEIKITGFDYDGYTIDGNTVSMDEICEVAYDI